MPLADLPQTNKQHAVPQNIMDVEFKLIGDLTMRQFSYLLICGGLAYFSAVTVIGVFKWPLLIFFTLLGLGLAFVPIQERGLDEWVVAFVRAVYSPSQRVWKKSPSIPSAFMYESLNVVKQELITLAPTSSRRKLEDYLKYQGKSLKVDPLDIPEQEYIMKIRDAYANYAANGITTAVAVEQEVAVMPAVPDMPPINMPSLDNEQKSDKEENVPVTQEQVLREKTNPFIVDAKDIASAPLEKAIKEGSSTVVSQKKPDQKSIKKIFQLPKPKARSSVPFAPLTPDMHAGRRFTNLLPYGADLILPIRGEKVLNTSDNTVRNGEEELEDKARKLQQLLGQIKQSEGMKKEGVPQTAPVPQQPKPLQEVIPELGKETEEISKKLQDENDKLNQEIQKLKTEVTSTEISTEDKQSKEQLLRKLQVQKEQTQSDYAQLNKQILDLQNKLKTKEEEAQGDKPKASAPVFANIQPITNQPNIISGIVKTPDGKVLESILLIVKNDKGDPVRAFKTNSLGQFRLITSLTNGLYSVEVSSNNNTKLTFDIISVEVKGDVIPPLEIIGKEPTV